MTPRFLWLTVCTFLLAAPLAAGAQAAARVAGQEIDRDWVRYYALRFFPDQVKDGEPTEAAFQTARQKVIANRAIFLKAKTEAPDLVAAITRSADLALARDYYAPYLNEVAAPIAEERITVETVLPRIPEQEDIALIAQLVMTDREALDALRKRIVAKEVSFEEAAKKHSIGLSAVKGGDLGGLRRGDDRYPDEVIDVVFSTPEGEITPVVKDFMDGRYSIIWVKDVKLGEEIRRLQAQEGLETFRGAERVKIAREEVKRFEEQGRAQFLLTPADVKENTLPEAGRPAFRVDDATFTVADVVTRSGGMSHGAKDFLNIAENSYRDLILQKVYLVRGGAPRDRQVEYAVMREHYIARRYLTRVSSDLTVTDADIDRYLAENATKYALPDRADLALIYVKTEERAKQVQERLAEGVEFETVAKGWSQDKATAHLGGKIGVVPVAKFASNAPKFVPGTVTEPTRVAEGENAGWYLFKVYRLLPAEPGTRQSLGPAVVGGIRSIVMARKKEERLTGVVNEILRQTPVELLEGPKHEDSIPTEEKRGT